ncbi:FAD-dependent monooxygenase [Devosia submarina]|uniref:FAD-dependent monooxygenase n=1 Tax=Devosia submarina TaxID=1173082 RepID=UPI000D36761A|nr:FAD-dependent monooxygenase [Devosia submarina]
MPGDGKIFYIAGAGITGLTLALSLAKFGASVVVLERSQSLSEFGAGLQISPNARLLLNRLGLDDAISARSIEPTGIDIYPFRRPAPLVTLELGSIMRERFGSPYAVMHRADLADVLFKAARRFANINMIFGVGSWGAFSDERGVTVSVAEADGQSRTGRADALIGADGVHSLTRRTLLQGRQARRQGRTAWRTLLPWSSIEGHLALDRVSVLFGPGFHLVCYPLPHRQQVNLVMFLKNTGAEPLSEPVLPRSVHKSTHIAALLAAAENTWTAWPLYTVAASAWFKGNIGLAGDAAHAMVPFQAQGAAMGIEDAAVLAPLLVRHGSAAEAFARYQDIRQSRVNRVRRISEMNGHIFHMEGPFRLARDLAISLQGSQGHIRRLSWLYAHDAGVVP